MGVCLRWGGDDAPSVRKPFSSVPRGCLGVPDPPAAAPPLEARSVAASCVWALGPPLLRLLRGRATTATRSRCLRLYLPWPAPPPSESGEGPAGPGPASVAGKRCAALLLRLRAGVCCRVCPFGLVREGGMPGWRRGGLSRPPGVARSSHASVESAALSVRSRLEFAAGGSALCAGTVGARLVLGGGRSRPGREPPPLAPGPGRAGRANGWCVVDGWRKAAAASPWRSFVLRGSRVWFFRGVALGAPGPARREEKRRRGFVRLGGCRPGVPGVAGPPCVSVAVGSPRCLPGGPAQVPAPCLEVCSLSVVAPGETFPSCVAPTASLESCVPRPPPGGHRRRATAPPSRVVVLPAAPREPASCRTGVAPRPQPPTSGGGVGVGGVPGPGVLSGRARCRRPGVCCVCFGPRAPGRRKRGEDSRSSRWGVRGGGRRPVGGGGRLAPPRGWLEGCLWRGRKSQSAFPGFPRDRPWVCGGASLAVGPRVVLGATNRLALSPPPGPVLSFRSFSPSEKLPRINLAVGSPPAPRLPRAAAAAAPLPPAPRCPGVRSPRLRLRRRLSVSFRLARLRQWGGGKRWIACRLPGSAAAPLRCLPPPRRRGVVALLGARCSPVPRRAAAPFGRACPSCRPGPPASRRDLPRRGFSTRLPGLPRRALSPRPPSGPRRPRDGPARPLHGAALAAFSSSSRGRWPSASPPLGESGPPCRRRAWSCRAAALSPSRLPAALARRVAPRARTHARTHVLTLSLRSLAFLPRSAHVRPVSEETAPRWRALPAHRALLPG